MIDQVPDLEIVIEFNDDEGLLRTEKSVLRITPGGVEWEGFAGRLEDIERAKDASFDGWKPGVYLDGFVVGLMYHSTLGKRDPIPLARATSAPRLAQWYAAIVDRLP